MNTTYAPNGILGGLAVGLLAFLATENVVVGIVVAIVASVACWYAIRGIEILLERGIDAGFAAAENLYRRRKGPPPQPPAPGQRSTFEQGPPPWDR